jgi:TolB-like protein/Tfp pilus assembly protein PilF
MTRPPAIDWLGKAAMSSRNFFDELKRRNVYKVAAAYAVVGWLLVQVATQVFPFFEVPNWTVRLVVLLIAIGFPIALVLAWAFELTPEGIKRTENVDLTVPGRRRAWIYVVTTAGALSAGLFLLGRFTAPRQSNNFESPEKSIAVLPFENLSRDPDNAYFTEGIQEEILTRLAKVADLKVISHTSTERYKSSPNDLPQIAKQLGVANILEGSVQKSQDQVRVNVQLIKAATDAHLWGESFDRKLIDIFGVESEIATKVADTLQAKLTGAEKHAISAQPTQNTEAYQLYLKGRYFWNKRTGPDLQKAIDYFKQAIEKDPSYALAYVGLGDSYILLSGFGAASPQESFPLAEAAAKKALEIDDTLAEAHTTLGFSLCVHHLDFAGSIREFERAIALNPNYATAHHWFGDGPLLAVGQFDRAIAEGKRALELDPLSVIITADLGADYLVARRYDEAIEQFHKAIDLDPRFYYAHWNLAQALEMKGNLREALAEYKKAVELDDDPFVLALLGQAYAKLGQRDEALKILAELRQIGAHRYVPAYSYALLHMALGEKDKAIEWLERSYHDGAGLDVIFLKVDPMLDPLQKEPRFQALVAKVFAARSSITPPP